MGVFRNPINCVHLDNWDRCKVQKTHWAIAWLVPKGRKLCPIEFQAGQKFRPQDDSDDEVCELQECSPRPDPPGDEDESIPPKK